MTPLHEPSTVADSMSMLLPQQLGSDPGRDGLIQPLPFSIEGHYPLSPSFLSTAHSDLHNMYQYNESGNQLADLIESNTTFETHSLLETDMPLLPYEATEPSWTFDTHETRGNYPIPETHITSGSAFDDFYQPRPDIQ